MKRLALGLLAPLVLPTSVSVSFAAPATAEIGNLEVRIQSPASNRVLSRWQDSIAVRGGASIFGGVESLDLFFVLDTSKSLLRTDPEDHRAAGAVGLVRNLPPESDIQLGIIDFDWDAELISPLTADRGAIVRALGGLGRSGATDLAAGIRKALEGFERGARPGSSRVILLFTDGRSDADEARQAMQEARAQRVAIHTLLLGSDREGAEILREIAEGTGGSFVHVTDPSQLPRAFLDLRTTGVRSVTLQVNGSAPITASLVGGTFSGVVPIVLGENRIVATATSLDGRTRSDAVTVMLAGPLSVAIDTPLEGTLLTGHESETAVEGTLIRFADASPEFLAAHPNRGVDRVELSVNGSPPFVTTLDGDKFRGRVLLREGANRIVARAAASDGQTAQDQVTVRVRPPGCAELEVTAERDGRPALSISDRAVEIVFDASNSMWGRMQGRPKISVAKQILEDALDWLPRDLRLALRVYGHQHPREQRDCRDSELLVPFEADDRARIRQAIADFRPRGQTPLAHSLEQIAQDFGDLGGERAVVLVTDGVESCGGDPAAAARALQERGRIPVHVIGFGLGSEDDEDLARLRAIADASGGRFLTAGSAEELRDALTRTVGTPLQVLRDGVPIARGMLGANRSLSLPAGDYELALESEPPQRIPLTLASEESLSMVLERRGDELTQTLSRRPAAYSACADAARLAIPAAASVD